MGKLKDIMKSKMEHTDIFASLDFEGVDDDDLQAVEAARSEAEDVIGREIMHETEIVDIATEYSEFGSNLASCFEQQSTSKFGDIVQQDEAEESELWAAIGEMAGKLETIFE